MSPWPDAKLFTPTSRLAQHFILMYSCSYGCTTSPKAKSNYGVVKLGHMDRTQVFDGGPHMSDTHPNMNFKVQVMTISGIVI